MATVTKLKASVNNINLPILGEDGKFYNYYVGRWLNKVKELGYTPTAEQISAVSTFINDGISNGWLSFVKYLMPFIGSQSVPKAGIVPLIDTLADYEVTEATIGTGNFLYDSNQRIKYVGGTGDNDVKIELPVSSHDFAYDQQFPIYINVSYSSGDEETGGKGTILTALNGSDNIMYSIRKGAPASNSIYWGKKLNPEDESTFSTIAGTGVDAEKLPYKMGLYLSRYYTNNRYYYTRYTLLNGEQSPRNAGYNVSATVEIPTADYKFNLFGSYNPLFKTNLIAFVENENINAGILYSFNQAVFALATALGR